MANKRQRKKSQKKEFEHRGAQHIEMEKRGLDYDNMSVFQIAKERTKKNILNFAKNIDEKFSISARFNKLKENTVNITRFAEAATKVTAGKANESIVKPAIENVNKKVVEPTKDAALKAASETGKAYRKSKEALVGAVENTIAKGVDLGVDAGIKAEKIKIKSKELFHNVKEGVKNQYQNKVVLPAENSKTSMKNLTTQTKKSIEQKKEDIVDSVSNKKEQVKDATNNYVNDRKTSYQDMMKKAKIAMLKGASITKEEKLTIAEKPIHKVASQAAGIMATNVRDSFKQKFGKYVVAPVSNKIKQVQASTSKFVQEVKTKKNEIDKDRDNVIGG